MCSHDYILIACKLLRRARPHVRALIRRVDVGTSRVTCSRTTPSYLRSAGTARINAIDGRIDLDHQLQTKRRGRDPPTDETIREQGRPLITFEWMGPLFDKIVGNTSGAGYSADVDGLCEKLAPKQNIRYRNTACSSRAGSPRHAHM